MKRALVLLTLLSVIGAAPAAQAGTPTDDPGLRSAGESASVRTVRVACGGGQGAGGPRTIADALAKQADRLIIEFVGTCRELVVIDRDHVVLRGGAPDARLIGSVTVDGASNVELRDLTVSDTAGFDTASIDVIHGGSASIRNIRVENPASRGIRVQVASAEIIDATVINAGDVGIVIRTAHATMDGNIAASGGLAGISITEGASVFSKAGNITVTDSTIGILVQISSSFANPLGSITASGNTRSGIELQSQGVFIYGTALTADDNGVFGMRVDEQSSFSPYSGFEPVSSFSSNGFGIFVERDSNLELAGATTITGNVFGIFVDESSFRIGGADIVGNFVDDIRLVFGSKASFEGAPSTVGTVNCDGTELIRGPIGCSP